MHFLTLHSILKGQSDESDEEWSSEIENNIDAAGMPNSVEKRCVSALQLAL